MSDQQHCLNCLKESQGSYHYPCQQCAWSPDQHSESGLYLSPGTILHNQYQIAQMLGHGGFGITYLAWDNNLETKLAIKEYMPRDFATRNSTNAEVSTFAGDAKENFAYGLDRFLDEARTLAKFQQHVGIVSVLNFFKCNGTGYMVMEYVDGLTLKDYVADMGKLSWDRTLDLFMPVMDALREVHKNDMLHRDISPDNIYLCKDNRIKLLDFGSARYALGGHSRSLSVVVKPGYAPEEQYRAKGKQGAWTDVYSVAASMYRCVTGVVPPEALDRMDEDELVRPSELGVLIPAKAEEAMMEALAIKAENRIQSIEEFQEALWEKRAEAHNKEKPTPAESIKLSTASIEEAIDDFNQKNYEKALGFFQYAAEQGDASAQNYLGFMFDNGHGVSQDHQQAAQWYQKAAVQGDARAQTNLGVSYLNGEGAIQDYQKAKLWFQKAADQGHADAQYSLGVMCENGQGIYSQDTKQAAEWYQKAADQGHADAQFNLERLHQHPKEDALKNGTAYGKGLFGFLAFFVVAILFFIQYFSKNTDQTESRSAATINASYAPNNTDQQVSVEEAIKFYNQGSYEKALNAFRPAAEQGNAGAQNWLGVMYQNGQGVTKDDQQAVQWYRKAAEQGYALGQFNLGTMYANGQGITKDEQQAIQWIRKAADQGIANAQFSLGQMYSQGTGGPKDDQQAIQWYRKAADQGFASAQYGLGGMYANGRGVQQDYQQAKQWFQKAADQGEASAQYDLGQMYRDGLSVTKNGQRAVQWFQKAADQGYADAQYNLGLAYANGQGVTKDDQQALQWIQKAADQGFASAQYSLGQAYSQGIGVTKDEQQAVQWYQKASDQGNVSAQYNLGLAYANGQGVTKDDQQAVLWIQKAANQGYAYAQNYLGHMYSKGQGVTKDDQQAMQWYSKAAEQGSSRVQASAQVSLGWYYMNGIPNLPIDYKKAVYWNELGANNGEPEGFNNLGWQYENGLGVKQDFSKAAELYQNAITKGIENDVPKERIKEAQNRLANIKNKINAKGQGAQKSAQRHRQSP